MFERFTDRARRAVVLAQEEARLLDHDYIGTEHLLLGLAREREGVAAEALESLGISLEAARAQVEGIIGRGQTTSGAQIPFTPRAKKVLELALRESRSLGHGYIGTEHILLGLIREGEGVAAQVLVTLGADLSRVRQQVVQLLSAQPAGEAGVGRPAGEAGVGRPAGEAGVGRPAAREPRPGVAGGPVAFGEREPPELVRVVPLAREATRQAGYRVVLISLEVWSNGVDLRYALVTLVPQVSFPVAGATHRWRLSDDLDTAYELSGVTSGAGRTVHLHQLSFQPAPPADASTLTLTLTDEQDAAVATVEVPLAGEEPA